MSTLTGLAYLLEHASFADKEAREKTEARIKPLVEAVCFGDDHSLGIVYSALNGDHDSRTYLGMEKGE